MGFFKKLGKLLAPPRQAARYHQFQVRCNRCGEILTGRLDMLNDPSLDYESDKKIYFCRKVLMGSGRCYQQVETSFKLDESHQIIERQVSGGEFTS